MKRDVIWMTGVATIAAVLSGLAYWSLNPVHRVSAPPTQVVVEGTRSGNTSARNQSPPAKGKRSLTARPFQFAPAGADLDDIAEVRFVDANGRRMSLADFRGKQVLLNIWATWCGPCREEMPTLDRLQTRLGGPDFEVVALSIDNESVEVVRDFYTALGLQALRIYVDRSTMAPVNLNVLGIPTTLLLDRNGRELGRYMGPADWDGETVASAIGERLSAASAETSTEKGD
jgi:thiol-disulfide isomerase/thioredoxin